MRRCNRTIVYIGDVLGYEESAMKTHAINVSKIFRALNYDVIFISHLGWHPRMDDEIDVDGFHCYYSERHSIPNNFIRKWYRRFNQVTGLNHWKRIKELLRLYTPSLILCYGYTCSRKLLNYSRRKAIPLIFEYTDWFEKDDYNDNFHRIIWTRYTDICRFKYGRKASGVILISDYLQSFYNDYLPTIVIPALCDIEPEVKTKSKEDGVLRIVYAGSPGKKDIIWPIVEAVKELNRTGVIIRFDIVGINQEQAGKETQTIDSNDYGIIYHGKQSHEDTIDIIKRADCSVLLRYNKRYAKAGFSTKFAESMWLGTPVLCTAIGGTDKCITDNVNGFLISDNKTETIREKLKELVNMPIEDYNRIKQNASNYARIKFDYSNYVEPMRAFLNKLVGDDSVNLELQ